MSTYLDQIREIEEEIRRTKINKATEGHVGRLKAKIARLKRMQQEKTLGSSGAAGEGYDVKKSGDSSVALIGLPSVGKSTLLNKLCGKELSQVGSYAFTTLEAIPGAMQHQGTTIQIIDLPGIISGASKGKGKGKRVLGVARSSDLVLIILDVFDIDTHVRLIYEELQSVGIRLNQEAPDIVIEKTHRGGISISTLKILTKIEEKTIKGIMNEYRIINANVTIRSDITVDQLIDTLEGNRVYIPAFMVINKIDLIAEEKLQKIFKNYPNAIGISAEGEINIETLKDKIIDHLKLIRIYLRPQGGETDFNEPLIIRKGADIGEVCDKLHRTFRKEFKFARIWGTSAKHPGQRVSLNHVLEDEDVLSIIRYTR
ncbi:MAG: GTP-binding protein [Candidatus Heimdallarchaeota archaeon]|nr:GTP-binding protein [Candidatus Heimdallarchaeota archaeon]